MVQTHEDTTVSMSINGEQVWDGTMKDLNSQEAIDAVAPVFREILGEDDDPADWPEPDRTTWHFLDSLMTIESRSFLNELRASSGGDAAVTLSHLSVYTDLLLGRNNTFKEEEKALAYFAKLAAEIYRLNLEQSLIVALKEAREARAREGVRLTAVWDRQAKNRPHQMAMDDAIEGDDTEDE